MYSDAGMYMEQMRFNKPGTLPLEFQTEIVDGCPLDCGLCPDHKQHACLGIIEVNTACNLDCPVCFADSGHQADGYSLTRDDVARMLDAFVAAEGEPEVIQFSGGEPTIHKDIVAFIEMAQERGIKVVMLNTNGIRLARDRRFMAELARLKPHVYLQFDGFELETHMAIRGKDLREEKRRALDNCAEAGVGVTLVAAIEKGVNEHEVGAIVRHGVEHPAVSSVAFQPVTHSGRHSVFDPLERLTNADVIKLCAAAAPRLVRGVGLRPGAVLLPDLPQHELRAGGRRRADPVHPPARRRRLPRLRLEPGHSAPGPPARAREDVLVVGDARRRAGAAGVRELRDRPARRARGPARKGVHARRAGLPGPLHAQRQAAHEVLRRGDHARRAADPVLRVQLGRLPRAGARADVGRARRARGPKRRAASAAARADPLRVEDGAGTGVAAARAAARDARNVGRRLGS